MVAPSGPGIARHPRKSHADPIRIQKHPVGAVRDAASRFLGCFYIKPGGLRDQARHQTATMRLQTEDCQTAVHEGLHSLCGRYALVSYTLTYRPRTVTSLRI